jgi:hypothetical protein
MAGLGVKRLMAPLTGILLASAASMAVAAPAVQGATMLVAPAAAPAPIQTIGWRCHYRWHRGCYGHRVWRHHYWHYY